MNIGFLGLGMMGSGMSSNLLKAGHMVTGYDLNPESMAKLIEMGGKAAASAAEAVSAADVVITMLPDEIGRASCRERVCHYVSITTGGADLSK